MKFIVDAQLPRRLARELAAASHDAVHTLDLPKGNHTPDREIASMAAAEGRVVIYSRLWIRWGRCDSFDPIQFLV